MVLDPVLVAFNQPVPQLVVLYWMLMDIWLALVVEMVELRVTEALDETD